MKLVTIETWVDAEAKAGIVIKTDWQPPKK